jgi:hypothetical protein
MGAAAQAEPHAEPLLPKLCLLPVAACLLVPTGLSSQIGSRIGESAALAVRCAYKLYERVQYPDTIVAAIYSYLAS